MAIWLHTLHLHWWHPTGPTVAFWSWNRLRSSPLAHAAGQVPLGSDARRWLIVAKAAKGRRLR